MFWRVVFWTIAPSRLRLRKLKNHSSRAPGSTSTPPRLALPIIVTLTLADTVPESELSVGVGEDEGDGDGEVLGELDAGTEGETVGEALGAGGFGSG